MAQTPKKAMFYEVKEGKAHCRLCHHLCVIEAGQRGWCGVRFFNGQVLVSENYDMITAIHDDPIEKKPLYHFMPGTHTLSIGTFGCNMRCPFCQNHDISCARLQAVGPEAEFVEPQEVVNVALSRGFPSISYTYNEPSIYYEYVYDTARIAQGVGVKNILVTNGHLNETPLLQLLPYVDAMNIDLKTMDAEQYHKMGGSLETVQHAIRLSAAQAHIEVAWLAVPGISADLVQVEQAAKFLASIDPGIPLHINRYYPSHRYSEPPTSVAFLYQAAEKAGKYLSHVHVGNV